MRASIVLLLALFAAFQTPQSATGAQGADSHDTKVIEETILWRAELDEVSWAPIELEKVLGNADRYTKTGNFYKVNGPLVVFGHQALYVGTLGVELVPGPNAVLKGDPASVSESIAKKYQIKFTADRGQHTADLKRHVRLIIVRHPSIDDASIVIGGYFGP